MGNSVSIVIPIWNDAKNVANLIYSLLEQPVDEIIFVDNGSTDNTKEEIFKFQHLRLIKYYYADEHKSSYYARNYGAKVAKGDFIVFIDSDCVMAENFVSECLSIVKTVGFNGVIISPMKDTIVGKPFLTSLYKVSDDRVRFACVFTSRLLVLLDPFDNDITSGQDRTFCLRHGYIFTKCKGVHNVTFRETIKKHIRYGTAPDIDDLAYYTHALTLLFFPLFIASTLSVMLCRIINNDWSMPDRFTRICMPMADLFYQSLYSVGRVIKPIIKIR